MYGKNKPYGSNVNSTPARKASKVKKTKKATKPKKAPDQEPTKELAVGVAIHTIVNTRTSTTVLSNVNDYQNPDLGNRPVIVDLSRKLRSVEGICSTVADLLMDFAITRGFYHSDNEELKTLLNKWAENINSPVDLAKQKGIILQTPGLRSLSRRIFDNYITDGDAVFTLFWKKNTKTNPNDTQSYFLPTRMNTIDTLTLSIDAELSKLGVKRIELVLSDEVKKKVLDPVTKADKFLRDTLPKEWLKALRNGDDIILDPNVTYHIQRNGKDYKAWGEPLFLKAFSAVAAKRRLQAVDDATIDGLINRFTVFKLGLEDKDKNPAYHIPSNARVQALIDILSTSKRTNAIVWPGPDLDIIDIGPDGKILEFDQKYNQADTDILRALHVSPVLIDGASLGQATSEFMSFLSTEVGLDAIRGELEKAYTSIGKEIALANSFPYEQLHYKFETNQLKDSQAIKNFAVKVFELGGISVESFVKSMGYDFEMEKLLKEKEEKEGVKDLFVNPNVPGFTGVAPRINTPSAPDGGEGRPPENLDSTASSDDTVSTTYIHSLKKIKERVIETLKDIPVNIGLAELELITGFTAFRLLTEQQLTHIFLRYSDNNKTKDLATLLKWNELYIDGLYNELRTALQNQPEEFNSISNDERIQQYANESALKASWVGLIAKARIEGYTKGTWVCCSDSCECIDNHGKDFDLNYLSSYFSQNCNCKLIFKE